MELNSVWENGGGTVLLDDRDGQEMLLSPAHRQATIGRLADFVIGESDTHVHRHFLTVLNTGAGWALKNEGRFLSASVSKDKDRGLALHPGDCILLVPGDTAVHFSTPKDAYEFYIRLRQAS